MASEPFTDPVQHAASPPTLPRVTFMYLPREIRDAIYRLGLVSHKPIIVWKGEWVTEFPPLFSDGASYQPHNGVERCVVNQSATKDSLSALFTNLLFCNNIISQEAARVFYKENTFSFLRDHNWDPIVSWLQKIGPQNRDYLSNVEVAAQKPEEVWQRLNGERTASPVKLNRGTIYPRHPYLGGRPIFKYGLVENINPALETIFELLGGRRSAHKVTLNFKMNGPCGYPGEGALLDWLEQVPEAAWHSTDLANLVEKFRILHTSRLSNSDSEPFVEVLWKGESGPLGHWYNDGTVKRVTIEDHLKNMKDHGWEVELLPMEEADSKEKPSDYEEIPFGYEKNPLDECDVIPPYILRRKLEGPLVANEPNPYSGIWIYDQTEEYFMEEITGWYSYYP